MKPTPNYIIPLAFSALAAFQTGADAAVFAKLEGIDGEVTAAKYKGAIDVTAWGWKLSQSADPDIPIVRPIELNKVADSTTPKLHEFLLKGIKAPTGFIAFTAVDGVGGELIEYMKIEMTNVTVSSYSTSGSSDDRPTENFSLNFDSYCVTFTSIDPTTGEPVPTEPACWTYK